MPANGITAVIRSLGGGGAERVLTSMLNYWANQGRPVSLITTELAVDYAYDLHPNVRCITIPPIKTPSILDDCPWDVRHLRQAIKMERNGTVISFMEKSNIPTILATLGLPIKVIVSERIDPRTQTRYSDYKKDLVSNLYPLADALVVQTQSVKAWAEDFMPKKKIHVIHNMVTVNTYEDESSLNMPKKFICCMGRMTENKGLPGLISILPKIFEKFPDYYLVILGDGKDRQSLTAQISALNLREKIIMPGFLPNAHNILKKATVFVLPSLCEGYPNALIEAMALNVAPISFACQSGPDEIISHNKNGMLIPVQDYESLAQAILELLNDSKKRDKIAQKANEWANSNCSLNKIMSSWNRLCFNLK